MRLRHGPIYSIELPTLSFELFQHLPSSTVGGSQARRARTPCPMSIHTALRLAVRPLRGVAFLDQLAVTAPKAASHRPTICLRCTIALQRRSGPGHVRLFSTAPPPPRYPPPPPQPSPEESSELGPTLESETTAPQHAPSTASPLPPNQPEQAKEPDAEPSSSTSQETQSSREFQTPRPPPETESPPTPLPNDTPNPALPSFSEAHRNPLSARFSTFMDNLQSRAVTATQTLNDLTGYSAIEAIKRRNTELESLLSTAQHRLREARHNYKALTSHRASTQREVTTLLARKDTWTPIDLERFTTLYRLDHELEAQVGAAAAELTEAETDEAKLSSELNAGILKRYHEEQIWSDRIRRQSTWGTWGLMGVNVVLFLVLQFVAEPWRRKRLMRNIAENEKRVMEEVRRELEEVRAALEASGLRKMPAKEAAARIEAREGPAPGETFAVEESAGVAVPEMLAPVEMEEELAPPRPWKEILMDFWEDPELLRDAVLDLYSDRRIDLRMRDASLIALQSAAAGAAVAAVLAVSLLHST
ncbi:hypothetical protein N657DRAFT_643170 [Parathielavia appendiculata]|uniref:Sensitive to high expression protein 9, mitochondrial n=1 Tax=Parathielavia appendiculata TaxID=2587402 RepID=A0AAN6U5U5_9PEZI|nr:hypothetical protein N657DRAFT_643170 [Parathielavia appendiculata]